MQKKVALVLSSGGARGLAHIGVIEEFEQRGYAISSVTGCSMGALIGGVYAAGKLPEFRDWMKTIDRRKMMDLTDFVISINHLAKGTKIMDAIKTFVPDADIAQLPIPYRAVATDWMNGQEVVFDSGSLFDAIRASISLPVFYEPVRTGNMILIDGGVINPLPLNRAPRCDGDLLVGSDVSGHDYAAEYQLQARRAERRRNRKTLRQRMFNLLTPSKMSLNHYVLLSRASSLMIRQNSLLMIQLTQPDLIVDIQMSRYGSFDFDKSEKLIALGHKKAAQAIDAFEKNGEGEALHRVARASTP